MTVTVLEIHTFACTGTPIGPDGYECSGIGANLHAGGNILVSANDDTTLTQLTIAVAVGYVGVGIAVGVAVLDKETKAYLGSNTTANALGQGSALSNAFAASTRTAR